MTHGIASLGAVLVALIVAACQGNLGSGPGLPQGPQPGVTPGGAGATYPQQSRAQTLEGAVYLTKDLDSIPLPTVGGFSVEINLTPASPTPAASGSAAQRQPLSAAKLGTPTPGPSTTPTPQPTPIVAGHGTPKPSPSPAGTKIETKVTIYPDDAPAAPTPQATGNVQTFFQRRAVVRAYLMPHGDVTLPSLAAAQFTIPSSEQTTGRGWTVALYVNSKHRKEKLLVSDPEAELSDDVVSAHDGGDPIKLTKNTGYVVLLFGDALAQTPAPYQSYPGAGMMPGQTPYPGPGVPGAPAVPTFPGATYPPGQPGATYPPGSTPYPQPTFPR